MDRVLRFKSGDKVRPKPGLVAGDYLSPLLPGQTCHLVERMVNAKNLEIIGESEIKKYDYTCRIDGDHYCFLDERLSPKRRVIL